MSTTCAQGALARFLVEPGQSPYTFDASSEIYDFHSESLAKHGRIVGARGITGSRSQLIGLTRLGSYAVGGRISMPTNPYDLDNWLPRILGGTATGDTFPLAESLPWFGVMFNRVTGTFVYEGCHVNRAVWRGTAGPADGEPELIEQILEIYCLDEDATATYPSTPPTLSQGTNRKPYIMGDGTLTIDGTTYNFQEFVLVIDNVLHPRWVNSLTPETLCPQDRVVTLRVRTPFTADVFSGLYANASAITGVAASLAFTNGTVSTTFNFTNLQWADTSPVVPGKTEIPLYIDFVARSAGSGELSVTNDATV